jgi:hypothetical protein
VNTLVRTSITAEDLLDAARTVPLGDIATCDWLSHWVPPRVFLDWARRGLTEADGYGLSNAVTYAKRAAACRIDALLQYNHLIPFSRAAFPKKIAALRQVGVGIPELFTNWASTHETVSNITISFLTRKLPATPLVLPSFSWARQTQSISDRPSSPSHGT